MRKKSVLIACGVAMALLGSMAQAEDLYEVYKAAVQSDPLIREAEARRLAALAGLPFSELTARIVADALRYLPAGAHSSAPTLPH